MATLAQMRTRIADDLNRSDLSTQIDKAINRAIEHYESEFFWFKETTGTFSTVANQESYSSSDAAFIALISKIDYARITISSSYKPELMLRTYAYVQERNSSNLTGEPCDLAWYQNKIYLADIPNSVWTVTVSYQKKYAELSNDSDTNDFTTDAEDLIESRAKAWLYARVIKDIEQAQIAQAEEMQALKSLQYKTTRLVSSRTIQYQG